MEILDKDITLIDSLVQDASDYIENYTLDNIFKIIWDMFSKDTSVIESLKIKHKLSKDDKNLMYGELEFKIGIIISYFYNEFLIKNKGLIGEYSKDILKGFSPIQVVENSIWIHLQNYLPKRISKDFRASYPNLTGIIDTGKDWNKLAEEVEKERLSPKINQEFYPYYQNGASNDFMNKSIGASKNLKSDITGKKHSCTYKDDLVFSIDQTNLSTLTGAKAPKITEGHKKLFFYLTHRLNLVGDPHKVFFSYNEFLTLKGLKHTKENRRQIREQLSDLNCVYWDMKDFKNRIVGVKLLTVEKHTNTGAFIRFGDWVEENFSSKFALIDKNAYSYNEPKAAIGGAFTVCQKLSMEIFLNWNNPKRNNNGYISLKVDKLVSILGFSDDVYSNKGFIYVKERLEKCLDEIVEKEAIEWQYRNGYHSIKDDFLNDYIVYKHDRLLKLYSSNKN